MDKVKFLRKLESKGGQKLYAICAIPYFILWAELSTFHLICGVKSRALIQYAFCHGHGPFYWVHSLIKNKYSQLQATKQTGLTS